VSEESLARFFSAGDGFVVAAELALTNVFDIFVSNLYE
jgi:hypothetical protein